MLGFVSCGKPDGAWMNAAIQLSAFLHYFKRLGLCLASE
jgi:hypothetical protein